MHRQSFTVVSLFKLVLICAIGSLVVRPVVKGLAQDELELLQVIAAQVAGSVVGIVCGLILGLTQFRQVSGIAGGVLCGMVIGFILGNISVMAGQGETAITMLLVAVVTVFYGLAQSAATSQKRQRQLATTRPPSDRAY